MMKWLLIFAIGPLQTVGAFEYPPERILEMEKGLQRWHEIASNPDSISEERRVETLARGLRQTSDPSIFAIENRKEVMEEVRAALLKIPGHADQLVTKVHTAREELKNASNSVEAGPLQGHLRNAQRNSFQTLGLLPSAESVRVLGEFLFDEEGGVPPSPPGQPDDRIRRQWEAGTSPNSQYALRAIAKLPIVSPPVQRRKNNFVIYDDDINSWRLWYEQIKAGTRTFQFEGDPTEYTLAGPVQADQSTTTARSRTKPAPVAQPEADGQPRRAIWPILASALALLAGAGWLVTARKKRAG